MRFSTFVFTGFAAFACAQSTDGTTTATQTATVSASLTPAQSSAIACIDACDAGDVSCQAKCIAVPDPSTSQVNATTECVGNCEQGNGTAADNQAYADCVNSCIGANYFTSTGTPAEATSGSDSTGSASAASATGTANGAASGTESGSSGTATKSSSSSSSTSSSSAEALRVGITGLSLFGMLAAFVAL